MELKKKSKKKYFKDGKLKSKKSKFKLKTGKGFLNKIFKIIKMKLFG